MSRDDYKLEVKKRIEKLEENLKPLKEGSRIGVRPAGSKIFEDRTDDHIKQLEQTIATLKAVLAANDADRT